MNRSYRQWIVLTAMIAGISGCADSAECDPGQALVEGQCVAESLPDAGDPDAELDDAGGPDASCAADQAAAEFGAVCVDGTGHTDCGCPADYCAVQPGQSEGYCTRTGCVDDPSLCPEGWGCLDLSIFQAGLPSICTMP